MSIAAVAVMRRSRKKMSLSGALSTSGAGPTVTSATATITKAANNPGRLRFNNVAMTGVVNPEYSLNGGAFTAIAEDTLLTGIADTNTLAVRIRNAVSGENYQFELVDEDLEGYNGGNGIVETVLLQVP